MRAGRSHAYREAVLPGPEAGSGYRHVLLVGPTGAGKTSLVRQLLGTERDAFPAVSASKTTVAETEIIMAPGEFYAVVTFMSADETRLLIEESVLAAIASIADGRPDAAIQRSLAHHTDQRFHLRYILGPAASADEGDLGASEWLVDCLARLRRMVADVEPGTDRAEAVAAVDWRSDATFRRIVHRLLTDVRKRFAYVEGGEFQRDHDGWPHAWHFSTVDRGALLDGLSPFVANDGADFGRLLTPLVNGVRVRGPFHPTWAPEVPYLMLTDTEGMGHTPATASAMPEWMADAADRADRIVVVDSATQPAQAATAALLRGLAESGHTSKLSLCFTHLDLTRGPNLGTESARREFLRSCLDQVVAAADGDLGFVTRRALQRQLDEESFFVGRPDEAGHPDEADPWVGQYRRFLRALRAGSAPLDIEGPRPVYRREDLVAAVDAGVVEFRRLVLERAAGRRASSGGRRRWW
ncbi:MAG: hypothetical protein OEY23_00470, partial [Acidimicrobiia bacterium]|nr:hypothetical protein [Acidimicrobiia bacterium]